MIRRYNVFWSFTYVYSSDASKANVDYPCGPGPYSTEILENLNSANFEVVKRTNTGNEPAEQLTVTTQLRSTPTGFLKINETPKTSASADEIHNSRGAIFWGGAVIGAFLLLL